VTSHRDNVFAGSDGNVFRRSDAGWEQHSGGGAWSGMSRVPESHATYRAPSGLAHFGGGFAAPEAGLDQHFAARSRGAFRSGVSRGFSGGFSGGGGGFRAGGGGGGFHGGGGGHGGGGHR
jgi:hypothetical protein